MIALGRKEGNKGEFDANQFLLQMKELQRRKSADGQTTWFSCQNHPTDMASEVFDTSVDHFGTRPKCYGLVGFSGREFRPHQCCRPDIIWEAET